MAECASRIRVKLASSGMEEGWGYVAAQRIVYGLLNARLSGVAGESAVEALEGILDGDAPLARIGAVQVVPGTKVSGIKGVLSSDIRALASFMDSVDPLRSIAATGPPGALDDGFSRLYERFLREYAPRERSKLGVFYTPGPVARFIVRMVDDMLKEKLGFADGLADGSMVGGREGVQVLDPATGTGVFIVHVLDLIEKGARHHIPRLVGYDLMPIPLAIARMRIRTHPLYLSEGSGPIDLIEGNVFAPGPSEFAGISVVLGNPPYSRSSQNKGARLDALLQAYKEGVRGDKNIQALSDDYIKFLALGQDIIDRNGFGVLAFVVNHTFLRGPIFRGMRRSLMGSFDELYVLDLHGNAKIQEDVPSGVVDQNVFPIQQGTCIFVAVKARKRGGGGARLFHHEMFGTRREKSSWLGANGLKSVPWRAIGHPREPLLAFSPDGAGDEVFAEYATFTSIEDVFTFNGVGGKPGDDELFVSFDPETAQRKVRDFIRNASEGAGPHGITEAKRRLLQNAPALRVGASGVIRYNYRPFDQRFAYFDQRAWTRPVTRVKRQCRDDNLILLSTKLVKDREFNHAFVARAFTDVIFLSNTSSTNCYLFPVRVFDRDGEASWNLSTQYRGYSERMGAPVGEGDLPGALGYIYAVLWSRSFKQRYGACLKDGAPRVPLVEDEAFHGRLRALGKELVAVHLLEFGAFGSDPAWRIDGVGGNVVEPMRGGRFHEGRLHINPQRYLHPVTERAFNFHIGKYQVVRKWLDDRVGRALEESEARHLLAITRAMDLSIDLIARIDAFIEDQGAFGP
ncbi:MAG: N-6 DNA methylase [Candidatus Lokiarchaeota archaeon]|nr:N-6 DNA methylase [Candidatus Lokiarchaeota archaeon]